MTEYECNLPTAEERVQAGLARLARITIGSSASLSEFLLARIVEDEESANVAITRRQTVTRAHVCGVWLNSRYHLTVDPARVLAECEAKRRIVNWCTDEGVGHWKVHEAPLRYLALAYIDHPAYRQEWKP